MATPEPFTVDELSVLCDADNWPSSADAGGRLGTRLAGLLLLAIASNAAPRVSSESQSKMTEAEELAAAGGDGFDKEIKIRVRGWRVPDTDAIMPDSNATRVRAAFEINGAVVFDFMTTASEGREPAGLPETLGFLDAVRDEVRDQLMEAFEWTDA